MYFHQGTGRATVFIGGATSRTFDLRAGDTAAFPDNSGYVDTPRIAIPTHPSQLSAIHAGIHPATPGRLVGSANRLARFRHYIENTSETEDLVWIEIYKSERVEDIPLTQWLALTPSDIVAQTLKVPLSFVEKLKKEKQVLVKG